MNIAVVGCGVSGLVAARLLSANHNVTLFESSNYPGGHANTVECKAFGQNFVVDTGFMVFNSETYPNFCQLLKQLDVRIQESDMSFSVMCTQTGFEYQGSSLNGLFAQRLNLLKPSFYGMLADIARFNRNARRFIKQDNHDLSVKEFLQQGRYQPAFCRNYLTPMAAAIWSSKPGQILEFPARFLLEFMHNHGLLQLSRRPRWKTICGGSRTYISKLLGPLEKHLYLNTPIRNIIRHPEQVVIQPVHGQEHCFDRVVVATHADQALRLLDNPTDLERKTLSSFPYQTNEAFLHTDISQMPRRKAAWASWNYQIGGKDNPPASVTYNLSQLQRLNSPSPLMVTLNPNKPIKDNAILQRFEYRHPLFSHASIRAQQKWQELNGRQHTYFCGAYWHNGFHEDGVVSALNVAGLFGLGLDSCRAACTKAKSHTTDCDQ